MGLQWPLSVRCVEISLLVGGLIIHSTSGGSVLAQRREIFLSIALCFDLAIPIDAIHSFVSVTMDGVYQPYGIMPCFDLPYAVSIDLTLNWRFVVVRYGNYTYFSLSGAMNVS